MNYDVERLHRNKWFGIYTREALDQHLEMIDDWETKSIIYFDIDGLKQANDRWGKVESSLRIRRSVERCCDLIGCWWSGDEILAIVDHSDAYGLCHRVLRQLQSDGMSATFVIAAGCAEYEDRVKRMDEICNLVKQVGGRGTIIDTRAER